MSSPLSTRVAVVQFAYHPAAVLEMRSPLEDPLFQIGKPDSLMPANGHVPPALEERHQALQRRIRAVYCEQLLGRVQEILAACRRWGVQVVVLPEYSVPWDVLPAVAAAGGEMVVVAGTHQVERDARAVYPRLGWPGEEVPVNGTAVCPVLFRGRLVGLQAKLKPAEPERKGFKAGTSWAPIRVEEALNDAFGVLICLDFLHREHEDFRALVGPRLGECRFLCVPSLTPDYTLGEFAARAQEEARRYKRPVLYSDIAGGGGTAIYVDEGRPQDSRDFPIQTGYLDPGDEGVIVADVELGLQPVGSSTPYESPLTVTSYAAASLVYTTHPVLARYAELLASWGPQSEGDDLGRLEAMIEAITSERAALDNVASLPGNARGRRLRRMLRGLKWIADLEELRKFTREIVLPPHLLPFSALRLAMARGARDEVFAWLRECPNSAMAEVEERLRTASASLAAPDSATWNEAGLQALRAVQAAMMDATASPSPAPPRPPVVPSTTGSGVGAAATVAGAGAGVTTPVPIAPNGPARPRGPGTIRGSGRSIQASTINGDRSRAVPGPPANASKQTDIGSTDIILDVLALVGRTRAEIDTLLGRPQHWEAVNPSGVGPDLKCTYRSGKVEIVFLAGKADWITVNELQDVEFSPRSICRFGFPALKPTDFNSNVIRWAKLSGLLEVVLWPGQGRGCHFLYVKAFSA